MHRARAVVEKVLLFKMKKIALFVTFLIGFVAFGQNTIVEKDLMVFQPTESSKKLNKAY